MRLRFFIEGRVRVVIEVIYRDVIRVVMGFKVNFFYVYVCFRCFEVDRRCIVMGEGVGRER